MNVVGEKSLPPHGQQTACNSAPAGRWHRRPAAALTTLQEFPMLWRMRDPGFTL